jgi:hypothetical protein
MSLEGQIGDGARFTEVPESQGLSENLARPIHEDGHIYNFIQNAYNRGVQWLVMNKMGKSIKFDRSLSFKRATVCVEIEEMSLMQATWTGLCEQPMRNHPGRCRREAHGRLQA